MDTHNDVNAEALARVTFDRMLVNLFRELAEIAIQYKVGATELHQMMRLAMVRAGQSHIAETLGQKSVTKNHVALLTGMTRAAVSDYWTPKSSSATSVDYSVKNVRSTILRMWSTRDRWKDENGKPLVLPARGIGKTFEGLVRSVTKNYTSAVVLTQMVDDGVVEQDIHDNVILKRIDVVPEEKYDAAVHGLRNVGLHLATVKHNLQAEDRREFRYEQLIWSEEIPARLIEPARQALRKVARAANESARETLEPFEKQLCVRTNSIGLGLYQFVTHEGEEVP